jgi:hypothetical protein
MGDGTKAIIFSVVVTGLVVGGFFFWHHSSRVEALGAM